MTRLNPEQLQQALDAIERLDNGSALALAYKAAYVVVKRPPDNGQCAIARRIAEQFVTRMDDWVEHRR